MKRNVFITLKGVQRVDDQEETIELYTVGDLCRRKDGYYLSYEESEATGFSGSRTTLHLAGDNLLTMRRSGKAHTQLIIEKGRRHQCHYETGYGDMLIGVLGNHISSTLTERGGKLDFKYSLDVNTSLASENEIYIDVKECEK